MCRCHKGVVINLFRVLAKATRRLHSHKNIAVHSARHEDIAVILHNFARCLAPILNQLLLHLLLHSTMEYETVEVSTPVSDWPAWAKSHGIDYMTLRDSNPWIRAKSLPNKTGKTYKVDRKSVV